MGFGCSMSKQTRILKEFRKYEVELYNYFFGIPEMKDDITFYFISKEYIKDFFTKFNFSSFSKELDNIILYQSNSEEDFNKIILSDLIRGLNDKIDNNITMEKINNKIMLHKFVSKDMFFIKLNNQGSFIPLTKEIWDIFADYYGYDEILAKKGFVKEGEIFILIEEEKKIDCFFTFFETKDLIYHYSFIMDNFIEFRKIRDHFKKRGPKFSARYLISVSKINIYNTDNMKKFKVKIPSNVADIGDFDITIYFIDSFKFDNYEGKNLDSFELTKNDLFQRYKNQNVIIIDLINTFA